MKDTVTLVIFGCGRIARSHADAVRQLDGVEIIGVCDHKQENADRFASELGNCAAYADPDRCLAELHPDAAVICTPTFTHTEYVTVCARHGVAVLCEKPLERTTGACRRLLDEVAKSDILFMTAQVVRFWPGYVELKERIDSGEFGQIYMIRFRRVTSREDSAAGWLNVPRLGGGAIHDMLVHDVDYLRYIAGPFESGYANAIKDDSGCYNNVMANIQCKNGVRAMAEASFTMQTGYPFSFSVSVNGEKATLEYEYHAGVRIADTDCAEGRMRIWRQGTGLEEIPIGNGDGFVRQMKYFTDCVRAGEKPKLITPEQSYEVIFMVDALHESARTGQVVKMDEYTPFDYDKR